MRRMINNKSIYRRNRTPVFGFVFTSNRGRLNEINATKHNTLFGFVFQNSITPLIPRRCDLKTKPNTCSSSFPDIPQKNGVVVTYTPPLKGGYMYQTVWVVIGGSEKLTQLRNMADIRK